MEVTMSSRSPRRNTCFFAAAFVCVSMLATVAADAHRGVYRHRHHRHHEAKAVIVFGKPHPVRGAVVVHGRPAGVLDLNVKPKQTEVWVDGSLLGTVDRFDGRPSKLRLVAGEHRLKLVMPGGVAVARNIRVQAGIEVDVELGLR